MRLRYGRSAAAAIGLLVLTGCTASVDEPVATTAEDPFVCDGVPLEGARLLTGEPQIERQSSGGQWGDLHDALVCNLETADGSGLVTVSQEPIAWHGADSADDYIGGVAESEGARAIGGEADGSGYAYPEGDEAVSAQWACGDHRLMVNVYQLAGEDRDPLTDVSRYLTSMLPWACGDTAAPDRTTAD